MTHKLCALLLRSTVSAVLLFYGRKDARIFGVMGFAALVPPKCATLALNLPFWQTKRAGLPKWRWLKQYP